MKRSTLNRREIMQRSLVGIGGAALVGGLQRRAVAQLPAGGDYDLVVLNGQVMDPASGLDAVRHVGIRDGSIAAITTRNAELRGRRTIDARGLVVAPGFVDLHAHGQDLENNRAQAMDGVTTVLELEGGTANVPEWYAEREGKRLLNFGVSSGHGGARRAVLGDADDGRHATHDPATDREIAGIVERIERGLLQGAVAVGLGIQYTPGASRWEIFQAFRAAAKYGASCHPHIRHAGILDPESSTTALQEVISDAFITGAPLHVVHVPSMGLRDTPKLLEMIGEAQRRGLDITTECYPYTAGQTPLQSAIFDEGWQAKLGIGYGDLQWVETGERLTAETFARYRAQGGRVLVHAQPAEAVDAAVASPLTMIASDGRLTDGKGHPRGAGCFSRVLGRYVRERKLLSLMDALAKMTIRPARRLERRAPIFAKKGRVQLGADADLVVFDADRIIDRSTFEDGSIPAEGVAHLLVHGTPVVSDGALVEGVFPGRAARAPQAR